MANSFWQREKGMKKMNSIILFSSFRKPENFRKLLTKEEEEVQRDSKVVKEYVEKLFVKVVSIVSSLQMQIKVLLL